ncbi:MAG: Uma2 family endonuclease [Verrucomicrobiota bacterium]|nr:Uma2 family endonuclease [Verrucomicrobiota bacterium]
MTWVELCHDKRLQDLPFKIELNRFGKIEMSPTSNFHSYFASEMAQILKRLLPEGKTIVECGIDTADGTKVAEVAWASNKTFAIIKREFSCSVAPEICVEVLSPFNSKAEMEFKKQLYLRAGAQEYWVCEKSGKMQFFNVEGRLAHSILCRGFPSKLQV